MKKDRGYHILILTIAVSSALHIFWLSVIKVVVMPSKAEPIKFSKVSFLGPILERGGMEVRVQPKSLSYLEKRYLAGIDSISDRERKRAKPSHARYAGLDRDFDLLNNEKLAYLIDEAVSGLKSEPVYNLE